MVYSFQRQEDSDPEPCDTAQNGSMGSSISAKRGYDTESVAWSQPRPPPLPSVGEWGSGYLTLGERKGPGQPLKPGYGGRGMSDTEVFYA